MTSGVRLAAQVGRVPSMIVPLDASDEICFQALFRPTLMPPTPPPTIWRLV
jgi:hypothetical protein